VRAALGERPAKEKLRSQRSILVTGGNGFLGKAVQIASGSEFELITPGRSELDISLGSTQLSLLASEEEVDCIVHLANPRVYTSNIALGQSLTMLRNVIDVCVANDIKLIYPSCWEVYSGYAGSLTADESTSALPRGPYGEAKYLAELLIEHCRRTEGLRCLILRSVAVYGAGGDKPKFIYSFIDKALRSEMILTHQYCNGAPSLDLLYVDDFVAALISALRSEFIGDLNIGTGQLTSTKKIAQLIIKKLGSSSLIKPVSIDAEVASVAMDWRQAREVLDWRPILSIEDGLNRILSEIS
jgi:UDP-glucuronate decarboxylase